MHLLRVWLAWIERYLPGVPLYNGIHLHPNCDAEAARHFWEEQHYIKIGYVWVSTSKASGRKRNTLPHGTLNIRVGRVSLEWYTKMMVWIELAHEFPFPAANGDRIASAASLSSDYTLRGQDWLIFKGLEL